MIKSKTLALVTALAIFMSLMWAFPAPAEDVSTAENGQSGTTLTAEKTATGFWEQEISYDWSIQKSANPTSIEINRGECATVTYTIDVSRNEISRTDYFGVEGYITVKNGGSFATENLKIIDVVQVKLSSGQFEDYCQVEVDVSVKPVLQPGESYSYPYKISFAPVDGATYRNVAKVTITNHAGHNGEEFGPGSESGKEGVAADFSLPGSPMLTEIDPAAFITDDQVYPDGFSCSPSEVGPWRFTGTGSVSFTRDVCNISAMCDSYFDLINTATLTESTTGQQSSATAVVNIYTGGCSHGGTLTIGYWKTHAGFNGNNPDRVTPLLPIWLGTPGSEKSVQITTAQEAVDALSMNLGHPSNGITKLYAQLLAAKLNIANGADGSAVSSTIACSDTFLADHNWEDWNSLNKATKQKVLTWMTTLDDYNNGLIGPGSCQ